MNTTTNNNTTTAKDNNNNNQTNTKETKVFDINKIRETSIQEHERKRERASKMNNYQLTKEINKESIIREAEENKALYILTLKDYKDTDLTFTKKGEKTIITVYFNPEEEEEWEWQLDVIRRFSDDPLTDIIFRPFSSFEEGADLEEEEAKIEKAMEEFAEKINRNYKGYTPPHHDYTASLEEIKQDVAGLENVEVIAGYDPENPITKSWVVCWWIYNTIHDDDYRM